MIQFKKISACIARSRCSRYYIHKTELWDGDTMYEPYYKANPRVAAVEIPPVRYSFENARSACTEHAQQLEAVQ